MPSTGGELVFESYVCDRLSGASNETDGGPPLRPALWRAFIANAAARGANLDALQRLGLALTHAYSHTTNASSSGSARPLPPACVMVAEGELPFGGAAAMGNQTRIRQGIDCTCQIVSLQSVRQGLQRLATASAGYLLDGGSTDGFAAWIHAELHRETGWKMSAGEAATLNAVALAVVDLAPDIQDAVAETLDIDVSLCGHAGGSCGESGMETGGSQREDVCRIMGRARWSTVETKGNGCASNPSRERERA